MAIQQNRYKLRDVSRDTGMKTADITALLSKYFGAGEKKNSSAVLSAEELDLIFECFTQQPGRGTLKEYFNTYDEELRAKNRAEKAAKAAETERLRAAEAEKLKSKKAAKTEKTDSEASAQDSAVPERAQTAAEPQRQEQSRHAETRPQSPESAPAAEKSDERNMQARSQRKQNAPKKPAQKQQLKKADFKPKSSTRAGVTIVESDAGASDSAVGQVRVDTRTQVNVNLAKYDERLNDIIGERANKDYGKSKQKIKQKSKQRGGFRREDESAKLKRLEQYEKDKKKILENVVLPESLSVSELAAKLRMTNADIVKKLMALGIMASASQIIDYDTASLVAEDLGAKVSKEVIVTIEDRLIDDSEDKPEDLVPRPPVVVVMGHVDHGKTSILDAIRHTSVTDGEAGGITQHIGAYQVSVNGKSITFLDTPGHAAFTSMRARGAQVTDIAVLVVAADDGIMPQTVEAINHAKAADVPIIVAVNKMDKPEADFNKVIQSLTEYELVPEQWGGDIICVPVSAHTKQGIDELLENIILVAEVRELKANPNREAKGSVIEAKLDKSRGPVATVLVQNGTLHAGDVIVAGTSVGRVRVMSDDKGRRVKSAAPSTPVEIIGLSEVPNAGDIFHVVKDEKMARELVQQRKDEAKEASYNDRSRVTLDDLFSQIQRGQMKTLNVIIKADVQGSVEAVRSSLEKLSNDEVRVDVIHSAVGNITENDVMLAGASKAIIIGFNIRPDNNIKSMAEKDGVDIRLYRVIYDCIEEMESALKGMLAPKFREVSIGMAEVRQTFKVSGVGTIAGLYVKSGRILRSAQIRLIRDGVVVYEGKVDSLKRFKDDVKEVAEGYECGISLEKFDDIKEGDVIEAFTQEQIKQ